MRKTGWAEVFLGIGLLLPLCGPLYWLCAKGGFNPFLVAGTMIVAFWIGVACMALHVLCGLLRQTISPLRIFPVVRGILGLYVLVGLHAITSGMRASENPWWKAVAPYMSWHVVQCVFVVLLVSGLVEHLYERIARTGSRLSIVLCLLYAISSLGLIIVLTGFVGQFFPAVDRLLQLYMPIGWPVALAVAGVLEIRRGLRGRTEQTGTTMQQEKTA